MPIVWKAQFTMPFIAQCLAGKVKGPKSFASTMATTYDMAIKTGFPIPPAPPVPLLTGKKLLLQIAITIAMLQLKLPVLKTLALIKGNVTDEHIKNKKQLAEELNTLNSELSLIKANYDSNVKNLINTLDSSTSPLSISLSGNIDTGYYAAVKEGDPCEKTFVIPISITPSQFNDYQAKLINGAIPDVLKKEIKNSTLNSFNLNSSLIDEFNNIAEQSLKAEIETIRKEGKGVRAMKQLKNLLQSLAKGANIFSIIILIPTILKGLVKANTKPIKDIQKKIKAVQSELSILGGGNISNQKIQRDILKKNLKSLTVDLVKAQLALAKIPKRLLSVMKINPLKFLKFPGPDIHKIIKGTNKLLQARIKELSEKQMKVSEERGSLRADRGRLNNIKYAVNTATKGAGPSPTLPDIKVKLAEILKCAQISEDDKQKVINSPTNFDAGIFIDNLSARNRTAIDSLDAKISAIKAEKELMKKLIKGNADKRKAFPSNLNVKLFNIALNVGLLAYWLGGTMPSVGVATVIFPGVPPTFLGLNVNFKAPTKFFSSLEKIFQMHALTVGGIYTPPPPAPPVPWVGYV